MAAPAAAVSARFWPGLSIHQDRRGRVVDGPRLLALGGEAGPEAVLPLTRLADGRLGVRAEGGGAPPVAVTVTLGERASGDDVAGVTAGQAAMLAELSALLDQALDQAVAERIRAQLRMAAFWWPTRAGGGGP